MENLIGLLFLLLLGFITGKAAENAHYKSIKKRESRLLSKPAVTFRALPDDTPVESASLAVGSVVVSIDYFKRFLAGFRMLVGGEMHSYSSLIDRGRREAVLRMKEIRPQADLFLNLRFETSPISRGQGQAIGCVEVTAYSTAIKLRK